MRVLGFRVLGFRVLGLRVLGPRVLGSRVLGFRGFKVFWKVAEPLGLFKLRLKAYKFWDVCLAGFEIKVLRHAVWRIAAMAEAWCKMVPVALIPGAPKGLGV